MKRIVIILICSFLIQSYNCFSQIETKSKQVYGYSSDVNGVTMGISFGKIDTTYYIRCHITIPGKEYRKIYLSTKSTLSFITKSGKTIDLNLASKSSSAEQEGQINDRKLFFKEDKYTKHDNIYEDNNYFTVLTIPVTKEQLLKIGSEPFYRVKLPYFENSSNEGELLFVKPAISISRDFIQKDIKYLLGIYS